MKYVRWIVIVVTCLMLAAIVVVSSGVVPAKASSGHWPITAWALEFAMERSMSTNSLSIVPPPLENEALITRGAAHFQVGCAWCHGQPGSSPGRIVLQMTPHPSDLNEELEKWSSRELFFIVRHGVKFTGMPGWPAVKRDDEVWGLVAFLERFRSMNSAEYAERSGLEEIELARKQQQAGVAIPEVVVSQCVSCHGVDGQGRTAFPSLASQKPEYVAMALASYRSGQRPSGTMGPIAAELSDDDIQQTVEYFAKQVGRRQSIPMTDAEQELALQLIEKGDPQKRVGACQSCHPLRSGAASSTVAEYYPDLNGQHVDYLIGQLHLFRAKVRGGGPRHHIMHNMTEELSDEQLRSVAKLFGSR